MKRQMMAWMFALTMVQTANAATIAVVDSGTDFEHKGINGQQFVNELEVARNRVDDDHNGKVDDVNGWNFVDKYNRVFYREHLDNYDPMIYTLLAVLSRKQAGKTTAADQVFWDRYVANLTEDQKKALGAHLNSFGQYIHGTHCSGIVLEQSPKAKILSARVFADEPPPEFISPASFIPGAREGSGKSWTNWIYKLLANVQNGMFAEAAKYLNEMNAQVANYSLGVPMQMIARVGLGLKGIKEPTDQQVQDETQRMFEQFRPYGEKWMAAAPKTLFVVAAGNDGSDNDKLPVFPANVNAPNNIRVAASFEYAGLGDFSNFGKTTVDVAAPGVAIISTVPSKNNNEKLPLSGTSMAAPFVAGVAGTIVDINPKLTPAEVKQILMSTVDKKPWLAGKVVSEGVVNPDRAYAAAKKSLTTTVANAVGFAAQTVADRPVTVNIPTPHSLDLTDDSGLAEMAKRTVF